METKAFELDENQFFLDLYSLVGYKSKNEDGTYEDAGKVLVKALQEFESDAFRPYSLKVHHDKSRHILNVYWECVKFHFTNLSNVQWMMEEICNNYNNCLRDFYLGGGIIQVTVTDHFNEHPAESFTMEAD